MLSPLFPLSFVIFKVPSFSTVPSIVKPVPEVLLVKFIVPLFLTRPSVPISNAPALFSIVKLPFTFETSPLIFMPSVPLFISFVSPKTEELFLIFAPSATLIPLEDVIIILPFALENAFAEFVSPALTNELNKLSAALCPVNTSDLLATLAIITPLYPPASGFVPTLTLLPLSSTSPLATIIPFTVIGALPANKAASLGFQTFEVCSAFAKPAGARSTVFMPSRKALKPSCVGVNVLKEPTLSTPLAPTTIPFGDIKIKLLSCLSDPPKFESALTIPSIFI